MTMINIAIEKGIYEHYKGKRYEVIGGGLHTETREPVVVYKALYEGNFAPNTLWVRPLAMFLETIEINQKQVPRFKFISP